MKKTILCISDQGNMLGGGEYSFLDLLKGLQKHWKPVALVPEDGEMALYLKKATIKTHLLNFSQIRPWTSHKVIISLKNLLRMCQKISPAIIYANGSRSAIYSCILKYLLHYRKKNIS